MSCSFRSNKQQYWRSLPAVCSNDDSNRTNPLSDHDTTSHSHIHSSSSSRSRSCSHSERCDDVIDDLDAKRPSHFDIQMLSAEFTVACSDHTDQTDVSISQVFVEEMNEDLLPLSPTIHQDGTRIDTLLPMNPAVVPASTTKIKAVRFSTVQVQEYARCAGDNPSVASGVPLSISWKVEARHYPIDINDYESHHHPGRSLSELRMGPVDRLDILRRCGFSRGELTETIRQVDICRAQRKETVEKLLGGNFLERLFRRICKRCSKSDQPPPSSEHDIHKLIVDVLPRM